MANDFTHLKAVDPLTNHEWAKEVKARLDDLNELLIEAAGRDVIVSGVVAAPAGDHVYRPTITLNLSERL